jgi:hypothetical protein
MAVLKFTRNALEKMKKIGLGESTIYNVWSYGEYRRLPSGNVAKVQKYYGQEIGFTYVQDSQTSEIVVTGVWSYNRR